jgi:hypothetical protein
MWIIKQHFYDTLKVRLHEIVLSYGESMTSGSRLSAVFLLLTWYQSDGTNVPMKWI